MKISACLVVYNEEKNIARALLSLKDAVDEIILVHDGECLDRTLKIAESFGAKIFSRPHYGFMEAHLPFCLNQAKGEWILRIDADEYLSDELKNNLKRLCNRNSVDAYEFLWPVYDEGKYVTSRWPFKLCLFKKEKISFLGVVHYLPAINGKIEKSDYRIMHEPSYNNFSWVIFNKKWCQWAKRQAANYFLAFKDISKFNYQGDDWPNKIKLRKKYPILLMPIEFFAALFKSLADGAYKERLGYKAALMAACYRVSVNYYIIKRKIGV